MQEIANDRMKWLEWRRGGLGSSDAPIVMGVSKWKKPYELFLEKTSTEPPVESSNWATERGNELEPIARRKFASSYNIQNDVDETFGPYLCVMEELPFMRASLDGRSRDGKSIVEIKFQGATPHAAVANGEVPVHYMPQLQHGLLVSGAERCYFVSINKDKEVLWTTVLPDTDYQARLVAACTEFWARVQNKCWPTGDTELFERYFFLKAQVKEAETEMKSITEKIFSGEQTDFGKYRVETRVRKGSMIYPEGDYPRKPDTTYKQIVEIK